MVKQKYVYDHGLPFSQILAKNLDLLKMRIFKDNKASLIIIDGLMGSGKTTLAVEISDYLNKSEIDFKKTLCFGGKDFQFKYSEMIRQHKKHPVIVYDESGDFSKRGAITNFNRDLNRIFDTFRAFKILIILVLPCFAVIDSSLFEGGVPRMLINCYNRSNVYGNFRVYDAVSMQFLRFKLNNTIVKTWAYQHVRPNFRGNFLNLPPERSKLLDQFSIMGKSKIIQDNALNNSGLIGQDELSKLLNRSIQWVRLAILRHKIQPSHRVGPKKFYTRDNIISTLKADLKRVK